MTPETFDIVAQLVTQAAIILGIMLGSVAAAFGIWAAGLGINVGIKKFQKIVNKA